MANRINRKRLKAFLLRRKLNSFGLLIITLFSLIISILCLLSGFAHTDIIITVTVLFVLLCFVQAYKMRRSYRTIRSFKGSPRRKKRV